MKIFNNNFPLGSFLLLIILLICSFLIIPPLIQSIDHVYVIHKKNLGSRKIIVPEILPENSPAITLQNVAVPSIHKRKNYTAPFALLFFKKVAYAQQRQRIYTQNKNKQKKCGKKIYLL